MTSTFFAAAGRVAGVVLLFTACAGDTDTGSPRQPEDNAASSPTSDQAAARTLPPARDTIVTVTGPTVIAFYHVNRMGTEVESATFRVSGPSEHDLSTFEYHLPRQQSELGALGWRLIILYRADFRAVDSDGAVLGELEIGDDGAAGYMVVAPGTGARIRYGVLDASELASFVRSSS